MFLNEPKLILLYTVKWFQVFPIQLNKSFIYTQLNDQTILFQTIQFRISHLFALSQTILFDSQIGPYQVLPLWAREDLEVIAMKE